MAGELELTQADIRRVTDLVESRKLAKYGPNAPPGDLVYRGNGTYYSSDTGMWFAKAPGGKLTEIPGEVD